MEKIIQQVVSSVINQMSEVEGKHQVPIAVSARHCHVSSGVLMQLFGKQELTYKSALSQPNQFAAQETVVVVGPRGSIERVRVLGPTRSVTQVEVAKTDAIKLGCDPPLRESGNIQGSSPITLVGPKGSVFLEEGLIIAKNHIHMSDKEAEHFQVRDREHVKVVAKSERSITFEDVLIRVSSNYRLEMHIDTDEANAGLIETGDKGLLIKKSDTLRRHDSTFPERQPSVKYFHDPLLTERELDVISESVIVVEKGTIITPLAKDRAKQLGKTIKREEE